MSRENLDEVVRTRLRLSEDDIRFALQKVREGNPLASEVDPIRRSRRLQVKANITSREAEVINQQVMIGAGEMATAESKSATVRSMLDESGRLPVRERSQAERIWGDSIDFVSVAFLEKGAHTARSVGRVAYRTGRAQGTGVLIGDGLFLTNNHVVETKDQASQFVLEFDYEKDLVGVPKEVTRYEIDTSVFIHDPVEGLDFTLLGVGARVSGSGELADFGVSGLSDAADKHMIGEFANIVQHPDGRFKEVVLRENRLINRFGNALHYVADTEPGSSGSPVYNSEWQIIALHHWGGPWIDVPEGTDPTKFDINEGIRISSIVRTLKKRLWRMPPGVRSRVLAALEFGERSHVQVLKTPDEARDQPASEGVQIDDDGRVTWTLPLEVSVRIPQLAGHGGQLSDPAPVPADPAPVPSLGEDADDYADRQGYQPGFLSGFQVPLPALTPEIAQDVARKREVAPGEDPNELKYHHFSVVVNKKRKLAFFTACNIDGATAKSIKRSNRQVSDLSATSSGLRETVESLEGAEADSWSEDDRLWRDNYSGDEIYKSQRVPGFPNPRDSKRIARMFQKGHLVRRLDPAWGTSDQALKAELDTFHWTNAAPQVGFFNQGKADEDQPGTGKGKLWRAAENYVLRNAVAENQRVISFTGPIFADDDRPYRDIKVPGRFFKVTVWVESGKLRSLALIVDQQQVFREWPENIGSREFLDTAGDAEAFQDPDELAKVADFLSTVSEVEEASKLDFGEAVRAADVRQGELAIEVQSEDDLPDLSTANSGVAPDNLLSAPDGKADDLKRIQGVGQSFEKRLNESGVYHFSQIAAWNATQIIYMDDLLDTGGRISRENWVSKARILADECD